MGSLVVFEDLAVGSLFKLSEMGLSPLLDSGCFRRKVLKDCVFQKISAQRLGKNFYNSVCVESGGKEYFGIVYYAWSLEMVEVVEQAEMPPR